MEEALDLSFDRLLMMMMMMMKICINHVAILHIIYNPYSKKVVKTCLAIRVTYKIIFILYINLIGRKLSKPDDCRHRPKHVVFHC